MSEAVVTSITMPVVSSGITDTLTISGNSGYGTIAMGIITDDLMEKYEFNKVTVEHKVAGHELLKLKEVAPTYADEIKENLSKNATRDIIKKMSFTKKHDKDSDVHHFIGRVWVFTEEELKKLIEEVKNA
jgi:hypothetical protein